MKRARVQSLNPYARLDNRDGLGRPAEVAESMQQAGRDLKDTLVAKFVSGEMTAADVCLIAYLHTASGGCGCEDLGLDTRDPGKAKNASARVNVQLQKEYARPDLYYVRVPSYSKKECRRVTRDIPIALPHEALQTTSAGSVAESNQEAPEWHDAYIKHPVVVEALANGAPESAIKPLALYFDGVQYSKRDSFIGFYFHDMKKNLRHLSFVVRAPLRRLRGFKHHVRLRSFVRLGPPPQLIAYVSLVVPGMNTVRKLHC